MRKTGITKRQKKIVHNKRRVRLKIFTDVEASHYYKNILRHISNSNFLKHQ